MRRVLVTGARGFVGRHLMAALPAAGLEMHAVTSQPTAVGGRVRWHRADLLDPVQVRRVLAEVRPDALIHLAWSVTPSRYWDDPINVRWVAASLELAHAFANHGGRRFIGVGSCAEYDWRYGYCTENLTPLEPTTLYGTAKATCGNLLLAFARETNVSTAWVRPFFLFGPDDAPTRLIPLLVTELLAGRRAHCRSGRHVRDYLFVGEAADALVAVLTSPVTGAINIGSGVPTRVGTLAEAIANRLDRRAFLDVEPGSPEGDFVVARVGRLADEVGWRPRLDFETAIDTTVRWWVDRTELGTVP